jgi:8-oxo-dGTP pyrophosphatase MutT (NUDIX family)
MLAEVRVANLAILCDQDVLLLERSKHLDHPGKLGFAGGVIDPTDGSPLEAALREGPEETGIRPEALDIRSHGEYLIIDRDSGNGVSDGRRMHMFAYVARLTIPRPEIYVHPHEHVSHLCSNTARLIDGKFPDAFYDCLLAGIPTILANLYAHRELKNDRTLSRAELTRIA